jgi:hypothetical protein
MTHRASPSHQSDNDLLTEIEAREEELPMSLAWFRRKRVHGGGPPFIRVSNRVFYRRGELRRWIADRATPVAPAKGLAVRGSVGARS